MVIKHQIKNKPLIKSITSQLIIKLILTTEFVSLNINYWALTPKKPIMRPNKRPITDYYKIIEEIPKNPVSPCFISFLFI